MAAYIAGDSAAFAELFTRLSPVLLRVLARQLPTQEEARDMVQQTFLQLHRSRHDFRPGAKLRPWLFTIAINLKREHFRRLKRRPESPLELEGPREPRATAAPHQRSDAQQILAWGMRRIPQDQAEVIALHWFEGLPFPEVAEVVGASLSAVKVRAHRGYQALRAVIDQAAVGSTSGPSKPDK